MVKLFGDKPYFVQGGDWGAGIATRMAYSHPHAVLGIHVNMVATKAADVQPTTSAEEDWLARFAANFERESGYGHEQGTRPQTLGVAMADSPVGVAAWILENSACGRTCPGGMMAVPISVSPTAVMEPPM